MQKGLILMPHISLLFFKPKSLTQPSHKLKGENLPFIFLKKAIKETQTRILFLGKCMCEKKVEAENQNMRE